MRGFGHIKIGDIGFMKDEMKLTLAIGSEAAVGDDQQVREMRELAVGQPP